MNIQRVILQSLALIVVIILNFACVTCFASVQSARLDNVQRQFAELEASAGGRLGVAAIDTATHHEIQYRGDQRFPMGCTSKVMGVAAILKNSMTDNQYLQQNVKYQKKDLVNWNPITEKYLAQGMTIEALCGAAISYSDNTAMNLLTAKLGGPQGINRFARSIGDSSFKLNHWWPDEAKANLFDLQDSSTPNAMARSLQKIALGEVLALPQ
ncbi:MAG: serine hydrolase, partial [Pseudomonadota bacterium]|nr:serine hydrolase [Pseudomonadota bacterium]